ncbi:hypothetical protein BV22DRAFT_58372 [Leucogyrophana mollusca]|uniref:Uncharacterized protein n=1 Tax=Leucogyrophana mollusca TaxID=85980 RepID=A0ACB8BZM7_9AGAM|nr:hypothetical protein BV22DRAFT_58372 [Leucogyrophana mollusca]
MHEVCPVRQCPPRRSVYHLLSSSSFYRADSNSNRCNLCPLKFREFLPLKQRCALLSAFRYFSVESDRGISLGLFMLLLYFQPLAMCNRRCLAPSFSIAAECHSETHVSTFRPARQYPRRRHAMHALDFMPLADVDIRFSVISLLRFRSPTRPFN